MKKFGIKEVVAAGIGTALFIVLTEVQIPIGFIPNTSLQVRAALLAFLSAVYGPVVGGIIGFAGHALGDALFYGSVWWSWVVASGLSCFIVGFVMPKLHVEEGSFGKRDVLLFNVFQIIGNAIAWIVVAPVLDIVVYSEPVNLVFTQGVVAAISNAVSMGVIGSLLLLLYSKTKSSKGSLSAED